MNNKLLLKILPFSVYMVSMPVFGQDINWSIETGLGYESNVFHAPDHAYVDTALPSTRPAGIAVTPVEKDGMFVPIDVQVDLRNKINDSSNFISGIGLDTKFMLDSDLSDASQTNVDLDLGFEYLLTKTMKSKKIKKAGNAYIGAFVSTHNQVYVDSDSGLPKTTTGGTSLSDKYSYQSIGLKASYDRSVGKMWYMAGFVYENLNYEAPASGAEYDHTLNKIELGIGRELTRSTDLKFNYSHSVRDYSKRYSRDAATGTYNSTLNDLLNYTYDDFGLTLAHKATDDLKLYLDMSNTTRTDAFEAYNDYSKTDFAIRARYKYSDKIKIRAKIKSSSTNYDNAYNFDDNTRGGKENSGFDLDLKVEHEWNKNKVYYVELNHTDRKSTDDRYDYTDEVVMIGAKWEY
ncbi:MAG: hypothetical protein OEY66_04570 [Gammaproteobacteria bacterium]|nr:hypothetical protein [Gammaproteobacteria bacterium]